MSLCRSDLEKRRGGLTHCLLAAAALLTLARGSEHHEQQALQADVGTEAVVEADAGADALSYELNALWDALQDSVGRADVSAARTWADAANYVLLKGMAKDVRPTAEGDCFGLPKKMCSPCPASEKNLCDAAGAECKNSLCSPLCLSLAWSCNIKIAKGNVFEQSMTVPEQRALCAQFVGYACTKVFKCCKGDAALTDWVEGFGFGESTSAPLLPIAPCLHDPDDKKSAKGSCSGCKAAISLDLKATPERCVFGGPFLAGDKGAAGGAGGGGGSKGKGGKAAKKPKGGTHKSLEERCIAFTKKVGKKIPAVMKEAKKKLCECAGCCDAPAGGAGPCYFPLTVV